MGDLEWYHRLPEIVMLTDWMARHGYTAGEIARAVDKPYDYADEYAEARKELDVGLRERPLSNSQAKRHEQ